jgi:uncharacterized coiled-coil protein SlyX
MANSGKQINRLDRKAMWSLAKYVEANYPASGLSDAEFAAQHQETFGLPLTPHTIMAARDLLDMPSNCASQAQAARAKLEERVSALEMGRAQLAANIRELSAAITQLQRRLDFIAARFPDTEKRQGALQIGATNITGLNGKGGVQ